MTRWRTLSALSWSEARIGCPATTGADASVIAFTTLETARINGLNQETYPYRLPDVLIERFADDPLAKVDDLMPWCEEMRNRSQAWRGVIDRSRGIWINSDRNSLHDV